MKKRGRIPGTRKGHTLILPANIPDDLSVAAKNALAARNRCMTEGRCPLCGAEPCSVQDETYKNVRHLVFVHDDDCPVCDTNLKALIDREAS